MGRHFGQLALVSGLLVAATMPAADLFSPATGNLVGSVTDADGVPQLGATIRLLNKYHQAIARATTDAAGRFAFASLPADLYSVQASLASFLPVSKDKVTVQAGSDSLLQIHLATLFSSVEVSTMIPAAAMSDDWKWVLRSSPATRPVIRLLPADFPDGEAPERVPVFSETHALLSVTGGDGGSLEGDGSLGDIGTGFAVSTRLYGKNRLQLSGTLGEDNNSPGPTAIAVSAVYSRNDESSFGRPPEIAFTAAQVAGIGSAMLSPAQGGAGGGSSPGSVTFRSMSLSMYEVQDLGGRLHIEYGITGESVDFLQHSSRLSPFARMTVDTGKGGQWVSSFTDGGRPDQLLRHGADLQTASSDLSDRAGPDDSDLTSSLGALRRLPQISSHNGRLVMQRTRSLEIGYNKTVRSRTFALSAFAEDVNNGRLDIAGDISPVLAGDVLSDAISRTASLNIGNYRRTGYLGSIDQRIGDDLNVSVAFGRMGGFGSAGIADPTGTGRLLQQGVSNVAAANLKTVVPRVGTKIQAGYGWVDSGRVLPSHVFTTQASYATPGLNMYVRQPVPSLFGLPGRLELTADLRNLLAQGYLPFGPGGSQRTLILQAPRTVRGGLNFTF